MRTACFLFLLVAPASASAQARRHDGFVGQLQLGLGKCTDDACDGQNVIDAEYETGLSFGAFFGYRLPTPYVSLGANLAYSSYPDDDAVAGVDDVSAHSWGFDFGARGHPLVQGPIDPWFGLGLGYFFAGDSWDVEDTGDEESTSVSGPGLVISLGGDFWISDSFAVGAAFRYTLAFWTELCVETEWSQTIWGDDTCEAPDEWEDRDNVFFDFDEDDLPDLWQLLLTGTFAP